MFKTGVVGAAVATVIAQIISAIYCIIHMIRHRRQLNLEGINFQTTKRAIKRIFQTGIPSALESCLISLGTMSVQRLVNSFGAMTMAGYTAAVKIDSIANRTDCIGRLGIVGFLGSKTSVQIRWTE